MDTSIIIFGQKFRLEVLILIGAVCLFIFGNTCYSCLSIKGVGMGKNSLGYSKFEAFGGMYGSGGPSLGAATGGGSAAFGSDTYKVDTAKWGDPSLVVTAGQPVSQGVQDILDREPQPVPLREGELNMFETTPFKPECCTGSSYSASTGCACMTANQYNYLVTRGGNNVPYSEY